MKKLCKIDDTNDCAKSIAEELSVRSRSNEQATVLGLSGDLGSGKTAFVKALAVSVGVSETVVSPTFVIEKIYKLPVGKSFQHLIHIDAYRLGDESELRAIGWDEILSKPENLIVIEWPGKVRGLMPKGAYEVKFKFVDDMTREISW